MYNLRVFSGLREFKSPSPHHILKELVPLRGWCRARQRRHCSGFLEKAKEASVAVRRTDGENKGVGIRARRQNGCSTRTH